MVLGVFELKIKVDEYFSLINILNKIMFLLWIFYIIFLKFKIFY